MRSTFAYHQLPNGLRIACERMPRVRSAAVGFLVRTGSRHEGVHEQGVSHFLEHMCFKGTPTRSCHDVNVRFDELGSIYNAFTSKEHTFYYGWVPGARVSEQLELLADMMRPSLPEAEYETERNVILEEIAQSDDCFDRHVSAFLHETVFGTGGLAHEVLGDARSIRGMPREAMIDYHRRRYAPDNMWLIAAGEFEPEALFAAAARCCADWRPSRVASNGGADWDARGVRKLVLPQFQQQSLVLVYPSVMQSDRRAESIEAFCALFGGPNSRCYWNIVQKGLCTQAGAAWIAYADVGLMALYAYGEPQRCEEMLAALRREAEVISRDGVTADEVARVRNHRRTQLALEAETPRSRVSQMVDDLESLGHVRTVGARLAETEAVTAETIAAYLREYPVTGEGLLLSVGPRDWPPGAGGSALAAADGGA